MSYGSAEDDYEGYQEEDDDYRGGGYSEPSDESDDSSSGDTSGGDTNEKDPSSEQEDSDSDPDEGEVDLFYSTVEEDYWEDIPEPVVVAPPAPTPPAPAPPPPSPSSITPEPEVVAPPTVTLPVDIAPPSTTEGTDPSSIVESVTEVITTTTTTSDTESQDSDNQEPLTFIGEDEDPIIVSSDLDSVDTPIDEPITTEEIVTSLNTEKDPLAVFAAEASGKITSSEASSILTSWKVESDKQAAEAASEQAEVNRISLETYKKTEELAGNVRVDDIEGANLYKTVLLEHTEAQWAARQAKLDAGMSIEELGLEWETPRELNEFIKGQLQKQDFGNYFQEKITSKINNNREDPENEEFKITGFDLENALDYGISATQLSDPIIVNASGIRIGGGFGFSKETVDQIVDSRDLRDDIIFDHQNDIVHAYVNDPETDSDRLLLRYPEYLVKSVEILSDYANRDGFLDPYRVMAIYDPETYVPKTSTEDVPLDLELDELGTKEWDYLNPESALTNFYSPEFVMGLTIVKDYIRVDHANKENSRVDSENFIKDKIVKYKLEESFHKSRGFDVLPYIDPEMVEYAVVVLDYLGYDNPRQVVEENEKVLKREIAKQYLRSLISKEDPNRVISYPRSMSMEDLRDPRRSRGKRGLSEFILSSEDLQTIRTNVPLDTAGEGKAYPFIWQLGYSFENEQITQLSQQQLSQWEDIEGSPANAWRQTVDNYTATDLLADVLESINLSNQGDYLKRETEVGEFISPSWDNDYSWDYEDLEKLKGILVDYGFNPVLANSLVDNRKYFSKASGFNHYEMAKDLRVASGMLPGDYDPSESITKLVSSGISQKDAVSAVDWADSVYALEQSAGKDIKEIGPFEAVQTNFKSSVDVFGEEIASSALKALPFLNDSGHFNHTYAYWMGYPKEDLLRLGISDETIEDMSLLYKFYDGSTGSYDLERIIKDPETNFDSRDLKQDLSGYSTHLVAAYMRLNNPGLLKSDFNVLGQLKANVWKGNNPEYLDVMDPDVQDDGKPIVYENIKRNPRYIPDWLETHEDVSPERKAELIEIFNNNPDYRYELLKYRDGEFSDYLTIPADSNFHSNVLRFYSQDVIDDYWEKHGITSPKSIPQYIKIGGDIWIATAAVHGSEANVVTNYWNVFKQLQNYIDVNADGSFEFDLDRFVKDTTNELDEGEPVILRPSGFGYTPTNLGTREYYDSRLNLASVLGISQRKIDESVARVRNLENAKDIVTFQSYLTESPIAEDGISINSPNVYAGDSWTTYEPTAGPNLHEHKDFHSDFVLVGSSSQRVLKIGDKEVIRKNYNTEEEKEEADAIIKLIIDTRGGRVTLDNIDKTYSKDSEYYKIMKDLEARGYFEVDSLLASSQAELDYWGYYRDVDNTADQFAFPLTPEGIDTLKSEGPLKIEISTDNTSPVYGLDNTSSPINYLPILIYPNITDEEKYAGLHNIVTVEKNKYDEDGNRIWHRGYVGEETFGPEDTWEDYEDAVRLGGHAGEGTKEWYYMSGDWKLSSDQLRIVDTKIKNSLSQTGLQVLPMQVIQAEGSLDSYRQDARLSALKEGFGPENFASNIVPVYFIRGGGGVAYGSAGRVRQYFDPILGEGQIPDDKYEGINSRSAVMGDAVIESFGNFEQTNKIHPGSNFANVILIEQDPRSPDWQPLDPTRESYSAVNLTRGENQSSLADQSQTIFHEIAHTINFDHYDTVQKKRLEAGQILDIGDGIYVKNPMWKDDELFSGSVTDNYSKVVDDLIEKRNPFNDSILYEMTGALDADGNFSMYPGHFGNYGNYTVSELNEFFANALGEGYRTEINPFKDDPEGGILTMTAMPGRAMSLDIDISDSVSGPAKIVNISTDVVDYMQGLTYKNLDQKWPSYETPLDLTEPTTLDTIQEKINGVVYGPYLPEIPSSEMQKIEDVLKEGQYPLENLGYSVDEYGNVTKLDVDRTPEHVKNFLQIPVVQEVVSLGKKYGGPAKNLAKKNLAIFSVLAAYELANNENIDITETVESLKDLSNFLKDPKTVTFDKVMELQAYWDDVISDQKNNVIWSRGRGSPVDTPGFTKFAGVPIDVGSALESTIIEDFDIVQSVMTPSIQHIYNINSIANTDSTILTAAAMSNPKVLADLKELEKTGEGLEGIAREIEEALGESEIRGQGRQGKAAWLKEPVAGATGTDVWDPFAKAREAQRKAQAAQEALDTKEGQEAVEEAIQDITAAKSSYYEINEMNTKMLSRQNLDPKDNKDADPIPVAVAAIFNPDSIITPKAQSVNLTTQTPETEVSRPITSSGTYDITSGKAYTVPVVVPTTVIQPQTKEVLPTMDYETLSKLSDITEADYYNISQGNPLSTVSPGLLGNPYLTNPLNTTSRYSQIMPTIAPSRVTIIDPSVVRQPTPTEAVQPSPMTQTQVQTSPYTLSATDAMTLSSISNLTSAKVQPSLGVGLATGISTSASPAAVPQSLTQPAISQIPVTATALQTAISPKTLPQAIPQTVTPKIPKLQLPKPIKAKLPELDKEEQEMTPEYMRTYAKSAIAWKQGNVIITIFPPYNEGHIHYSLSFPQGIVEQNIVPGPKQAWAKIKDSPYGIDEETYDEFAGWVTAAQGGAGETSGVYNF